MEFSVNVGVVEKVSVVLVAGRFYSPRYLHRFDVWLSLAHSSLFGVSALLLVFFFDSS